MTGFFLAFGAVWLVNMAYGLSAWRLAFRIRGLKEAGAATDAPDIWAGPLDLFRFLGWLLTGRFAELGDPVATRWAAIARPLFMLAMPSLLGLFAWIALHPELLNG